MWMVMVQFMRANLLWEMLVFVPVCGWIATRSRWKAVQGAAQGLALVFVTLACVELLLRWVDPWGSWAYQQDVAMNFRQATPHATRGFALRDGVLSWTNGAQATIRDGQRWTPHSQASDCQIVVLGDSVTFGFGVNDEDVYVDRLAARFPQASWANAGVSSYDHPSLRAVYDETPADGYLYLLIDNDLVAPGLLWYAPYWQTARPGSALRGYQQTFVGSVSHYPPVIPAATWADLAFVHDPRVLAFTVDQENLALEAARQTFGADLVVVPMWSETISFADSHPTAAGHAQLATSMAPYVEDWLPSVCGAVAEQ